MALFLFPSLCILKRRSTLPEAIKYASLLVMDKNKVYISNVAYYCDHTHILYSEFSNRLPALVLYLVLKS